MEKRQTFHKDLWIMLALELDMYTLINLCQTSSQINSKVCEKDYFWIQKLQKEYPEYANHAKVKAIKEAKNRYFMASLMKLTYQLTSGYDQEEIKIASI